MIDKLSFPACRTLLKVQIECMSTTISSEWSKGEKSSLGVEDKSQPFKDHTWQ